MRGAGQPGGHACQWRRQRHRSGPISALLALLAVIADRCLPDPRRGHPLALFGRLAASVESRLNRRPQARASSRWRGALGMTLLVLPLTLFAWLLSRSIAGPVVDLVLLWFALGAHSLERHALRVADALRRGHLSQARHRVSWLVSRETAALDATQVAAATTESVLENGNDAIFSALFWFAIGGGPAALAFRLINTLDAMWGYRTPRYRYFGSAAARLDDIAGWLPARLTALSYAALGPARHGHQALRCWRQQAAQLDSPNAGPVMASGAGALGIILGGPTRYHGELRDKPRFGSGRPPQPGDIARATQLINRSLALWLLVLSSAALISWGLRHA